MKSYAIYGNCQSATLSRLLKKDVVFNRLYELKSIPFVQDIKESEVDHIQKSIFSKIDLLIYQEISDNYRINQLSTKNILQHIQNETIKISFPSLYFNAYFPHLDTYKEGFSVLNMVHDYFVMYSYIKGLSEEQTISLIQRENLYPKYISEQLLDKSLKQLVQRENNLDVKVSEFIKNNFRYTKLFNQFNHPKIEVFEHVTNQVLSLLSMKEEKVNVVNMKGLDGIESPIYPSTYKNLGLEFEENFQTYTTHQGKKHIDEVVHEFFKTYESFDKKNMENAVMVRKPFIIDIFKEHNL